MLPETAATPGSDQQAKRKGVRKHSWAYIKRIICENYQGIKPNDIPKMTLDDIIILTCDKKILLAGSGGSTTMSIKEASEAGVKMPKNPFGKKTVAQHVRWQLDEKAELERIKEKLDSDKVKEREQWEGSGEFSFSKRLTRACNKYEKRAKNLEDKWYKGI